MGNNFFEKNYTVHYYETGPHQQLRISNLMNYFEEVALMQSEERKVGLDYYWQNGVIWMLHKWNISIHKSPVFGQNIRIRTLPVSIAGFMGFRQFWVYGEHGEILVSAESAWIFVNTQSKRPMRVTEDMKRAYGHLGQPESKLDMPEVPSLQRADFTKEFNVRQADIDINEHVNNVRYVDWALEALPPKLLRNHQLENIQIVFKKETTYGQRISSQVEVLQEAGVICFVHRIVDEQGKEVCALLTSWKPA
jgi:medium-chain acyl-[acyl-carrier-protein] hydrolase